MRQSPLAPCLLAFAAAALAFSATPSSADAQDYFSLATRTYKVEVQYWFFDTDYYYWSTVLETDDYSEADFVYSLLLMAQEDGQLNQYAPHSYWRYFAVDVRMRTCYNLPQFASPWYAELEPIAPTYRSYSRN